MGGIAPGCTDYSPIVHRCAQHCGHCSSAGYGTEKRALTVWSASGGSPSSSWSRRHEDPWRVTALSVGEHPPHPDGRRLTDSSVYAFHGKLGRTPRWPASGVAPRYVPFGSARRGRSCSSRILCITDRVRFPWNQRTDGESRRSHSARHDSVRVSVARFASSRSERPNWDGVWFRVKQARRGMPGLQSAHTPPLPATIR